MDGPEKFSRSVRFTFLLILVSLTWVLVAVSLALGLSSLSWLAAELELLGRNG